jgi:hypothetical protein
MYTLHTSNDKFQITTQSTQTSIVIDRNTNVITTGGNFNPNDANGQVYTERCDGIVGIIK